MTHNRSFAGNVLIDSVESQVYIDGVRIPWWLTADPGPVVDKVPDAPLHVLHLDIFVEGFVTLVGDDASRETLDPVLGNVREWAANHVREGLKKAYPNLDDWSPCG